jgi:6-pyruvoyl-tetrahydropterin synthase
MAMYEVLLGKDRQKFSCGHFTVFADGTVERLHGHNYHVAVTLRGPTLQTGLLFPFHTVKATIVAICNAWDERILLPTVRRTQTRLLARTCAMVTLTRRWLQTSPAVQVKVAGEQVEVAVAVGAAPGAVRHKRYSLPTEDVVLLECDNITCENLARVAHTLLLARTDPVTLRALTAVTVTVSESDRQSVAYGGPLEH